MFLLRSAFWLTVAFMVIRPEVDVGSTAADLSGQAMAAGSAFVTEQIGTIACDSLECHGGKALAVAAISVLPSIEAAQPENISVPLPRPRPKTS